MNFLRELSEAGVTWTINPHIVRIGNHQRRVLQVSIKADDRELNKIFENFADWTVDHLLAATFRVEYKEHPLYIKWRESLGHCPVTLIINEDEMQWIGEVVHTGLRKLADSKQSCITWNAIHNLRDEDRAALWDKIREAVQEAFKNGAPSHYMLATVVKTDVINLLEELSRDRSRRTDAEKFALRMLIVGCEMTEIEEWMYGWLGYVVQR